MRELLASLLVALLAAPAAPPPLRPARVAGTVTVAGRALSGIDLALVDLESGAVHRATSSAGGDWAAELPPGRYALAAEGASGLAVVRGPALLSLGAGQLARADLALAMVPLGSQETPATPAKLTLEVEPVGCLLEGQHPLIKARVTPPEAASLVQVHFRSVLASGFFYVVAQLEEGVFVGKLPAPKREASPVTIFVKAFNAGGETVQSPEMQAQVVGTEAECPAGLAAVGPPGGIEVFSAATGAAVTPAGFAASGVAATAGALALLLSGAAAAGITATVVVTPTPRPPTPSPAITPTPTPRPPRPSPTPRPTPIPQPRPPKPPITTVRP